MKLPIAPMHTPSCLKGQENGKLTPELLVPCGLEAFTMVPPAARSMKALTAAAKAAGFKPTATGVYRSYAAQVTLFRARYSQTELAGRPTKTWQGKTWWQRPHTAMAATPGTSNHGWGLAADLAEKRTVGLVPVTASFVAWLCANAFTFGFSAEDQSEVWHWRYVAGDNIPAAVLAFEAGTTVKPARPVLRVGASGESVKELQTILNALGFKCGKVDGSFGPRTLSAVRLFQKNNPPLTIDGVVGAATWAVLDEKAKAA